MSTSPVATPASDHGHAITTTDIRQWVAPAAVIVSLVAFIVYLSAALASTKDRIAAIESDRAMRGDVKALEDRVARVESKGDSDHELLLKIVRRLDLLICKTDPDHCEAQ